MSHWTRERKPIIRDKKRASWGNYGYSSGSLSFGASPAILLHGAGVSGFDELVIFGGIGLIVVGLIFLSWRAGRKRKRVDGARRRRR